MSATAADKPFRFQWLDVFVEVGMRDLSAMEVRAGILMFRHADKNGGNAYPGLDRLQFSVARESRTRASAAVKSLMVKGWICQMSRGGGRGKATVYGLTIPPAAKDQYQARLDQMKTVTDCATVSKPETVTDLRANSDVLRPKQCRIPTPQHPIQPSLNIQHVENSKKCDVEETDANRVIAPFFADADAKEKALSDCGIRGPNLRKLAGDERITVHMIDEARNTACEVGKGSAYIVGILKNMSKGTTAPGVFKDSNGKKKSQTDWLRDFKQMGISV